MQKLNFPTYSFRFKNSENKVSIFDEIRKKFILLTPEEWVRQHVVEFLLNEKKYSKSLINVEKVVKVNGMNKRYDVIVFNSDGSIFLLIECKAPEVKIDQKTFDLSAKNPNKKEETALRQPQEILEEMKALDEESADILNSILELI